MKKNIIFIIIGIIIFFTIVYIINNVLEKNIEMFDLAEEDINYLENTNKTENLELLENIESTASEEIVVSPNAIITTEKYYKLCGHTVSRFESIPFDLVNKTKEEVELEYNTWELKEFASDSIVLYQENEGQCGEHYVLKEEIGVLNIYQINESGEEVFLEETDISTEYLTETDMIDIQNGLKVYGKENLNSLLEDFE